MRSPISDCGKRRYEPAEPLGAGVESTPAPVNPGLKAMSTTVFSDIDWEKDGKQVGGLFLPHSPDDDAWGVIP
jgi:hypothetical protein